MNYNQEAQNTKSQVFQQNGGLIQEEVYLNQFDFPDPDKDGITQQERHQWMIEEDILITVFVNKFGTKKWNVIADELKSRINGSRRNGKQCRERWHNHLDPKVRKSPWNQNEEYVFIEAHKIHGNKWAEIAKYIPGRTDNSIKNHFYSTLRKLISRLQKNIFSNKTFSDQTSRDQTYYFIEYLQKIMILSQKQGNQDEVNGRRNSYKRRTSIISHMSNHTCMQEIKLAQFDIYLVRKLKENQITLPLINKYLCKLKEIKMAQKNLQKKEQSLQRPSMNESLLQKRPGLDFNNTQQELKMSVTKYQKVQNQSTIVRLPASHNLCEPTKNSAQLDPRYQVIFRIEKDSQRLIEREIMHQKRLRNQHSQSSMRNNSFSMPTSNLHVSQNQSEHFNVRIKNIIDHKAILDEEYLKEIDPKKYRQNIFRMLKMSKITDKINRGGILDDLLAEMKQEKSDQSLSKESLSNLNTQQNQFNPITSFNIENSPSPIQPQIIPIQQNINGLKQVQASFQFHPDNLAQYNTLIGQNILDQNQINMKTMSLQQQPEQSLKQSNFAKYNIITAQMPSKSQGIAQQTKNQPINKQIDKPSFSSIVQNMHGMPQNQAITSVNSQSIQQTILPIQQINPPLQQNNLQLIKSQQSHSLQNSSHQQDQNNQFNQSITQQLGHYKFQNQSLVVKQGTDISIKLPSIKDIKEIGGISHYQETSKALGENTESRLMEPTQNQLMSNHLPITQPVQLFNQNVDGNKSINGLSNQIKQPPNLQVVIPAKNVNVSYQVNHQKKFSFGVSAKPLYKNLIMPSIVSQSIQTQYISENKSAQQVRSCTTNELQPQVQLVKNIKSKALNQIGFSKTQNFSVRSNAPFNELKSLQPEESPKKLQKFGQISLDLPMYAKENNDQGQIKQSEAQIVQVIPGQVTKSVDKQIETNKLQIMQQIFDITNTKNYLSKLNNSLVNSNTIAQLSNNGSHGSQSRWNGNIHKISQTGTKGNVSQSNQMSQFHRSNLTSMPATTHRNTFQSQNKGVTFQKPLDINISQESSIKEQVNAINKQIQDALNYSEKSSVNQIQAQVQQSQNIFGRRRSISCCNILNPQQVAQLQQITATKNRPGVFGMQNQPLNLNIVDPSLIRIHKELKLSDKVKGIQKDNSNQFFDESLKCGSNASFYYPTSRQSSPKNDKSAAVQNFIQHQFQNNQPNLHRDTNFQNQILEQIGRNFNLKELRSQFGQSQVQKEYPETESNHNQSGGIKSNSIDMNSNKEPINKMKQSEEIREIELIQQKVKIQQKQLGFKLATLEKSMERIELSQSMYGMGSGQNDFHRIEIQQILNKLKEEFAEVEKQNEFIQSQIDNASGSKQQSPSLPKMLTVRNLIEKQQISNSRASSMYNFKVQKDHDEQITQKMLIVPKIPQFEKQNDQILQQNTQKQPSFVVNRGNQTKKGCVPSKFAQNQNESMHDFNSSSSEQSKPHMNQHAVQLNKKQGFQSPQFQRDENSLTIKDLIQAQIQNIEDSQNKARIENENSDSNQLYNSQNLKDIITGIQINLGQSNSISHSLSSSSGYKSNFKLIKDQESHQQDEEMGSDQGQSVSSASLNNVPQSSVPRLQGLNEKREQSDSYYLNQKTQNSKKAFKSYDMAMAQAQNSQKNSSLTLNKSYHRVYLESIENELSVQQSVKRDQNMSLESRKSNKIILTQAHKDPGLIGQTIVGQRSKPTQNLSQQYLQILQQHLKIQNDQKK